MQTGVKRPSPSSRSFDVSSIDVLTKDEDELPFQVVKKKTNKKSKISTGSTPKTMGQQLEPAKEFVNINESKLPMSYKKVLEFLQSTQGKSRSEITQLARISCDDLGSLDDMLSDIYKHGSSRTLRSRLTRVKKCLCPSNSRTEDKHSDVGSLAEGMTTDDQLNDEDFNPTASRNGSTTQKY
ncbi:hypothetical protein QAD02_003165 [Eretmocerus hayati]|uniref:Uncharacterized protein n=1 Tax=Eretmocerus hayati TaxID=131215 RepID=A0ACC2NMQ5_9HYME|nr:hypothetical protein QAD02_003165 [Eretmocerus hayati]